MRGPPNGPPSEKVLGKRSRKSSLERLESMSVLTLAAEKHIQSHCKCTVFCYYLVGKSQSVFDRVRMC